MLNLVRSLHQRFAGAVSPLEAAGIDASDQYLCKAFKVVSTLQLQELINALLLSECVYKFIGVDKAHCIDALNELQQHFPAKLVSLQAVQFVQQSVPHRYLVASSETSLFVAIPGTKFPRDLLTDATYVEELVWRDQSLSATVRSAAPAAHRGFVQRARTIPAESLYTEALQSNRTLVLCGHSLGGAVAALSTVRLLRQLPQGHTPKVKCICFGTPAVGNAALAQLVSKSGWESLFHCVALPGDIIPGLWALRPQLAEAQAVAQKLQASELNSLARAAGSQVSAVGANVASAIR
ncbi:hypothetical protein WJX73_000286 [Symbiochloris irregularis]|uniref:Fungal lipase-type domain-containing protein n=1 Tax=Symbiochloris irregularis TaxID=706552 RepID=A0AAW1NVE3_9CHLO